MTEDLRTRLRDLSAALHRLDTILASGQRLPLLPLCRVALAVDAAAKRLTKLTDRLTPAAEPDGGTPLFEQAERPS